MFAGALPPLSPGVCTSSPSFPRGPRSSAHRTPSPPAHIAFAEGSASLDREGQSQPVTAGLPFLVGDRLRTTDGRIEVLFPDGSALDIDEYSSVDLLSPTLLRVTGGRIMLIVAGAEDPAGALRYQVDTPVASASTDGPGEYRVALLSGPAGLEAELAVLRGLASLRTERGSTPVRAGERSLARDLEAPSFPHTFNSARFDAFDRWSALRRDARTGYRAVGAISPARVADVRRHLRPSWRVAARTAVRVRVVSRRLSRLAAVLQRLLVGEPSVRMDLDWPGRLGMADASLWPLGHLAQPVVLDSGAPVGALVGDLGRGAWLRELVPARFRQPSRVRTLGECRQPLARVGGRPAHALRRAWRVRAPLRGPASARHGAGGSAGGGTCSAPRGTSGWCGGADRRCGRAPCVGSRSRRSEGERVRGIWSSTVSAAHRTVRRWQSATGGSSPRARRQGSRIWRVWRVAGLPGWSGRARDERLRSGGRTITSRGDQGAARRGAAGVSATSRRSHSARPVRRRQCSRRRAVTDSPRVSLVWTTTNAVVRRRRPRRSAHDAG